MYHTLHRPVHVGPSDARAVEVTVRRLVALVHVEQQPYTQHSTRLHLETSRRSCMMQLDHLKIDVGAEKRLQPVLMSQSAGLA